VNRNILFFIFFFIFTQCVYAQEVQVPSGIRYKYANAETNKESERIISILLEGSVDAALINDVLSGPVICGPYIWYRLKDYAETSNLSHSFSPSSIPIYKNGKIDKYIVMEGRLLRTTEDGNIFWEIFKKHYLQKQKFHIRKLTPEELSELWAMIAWDIEEPIFIAENGNTKILFHFGQKNGKMNLFYIDDFSDVNIKTSIGVECAPEELNNTIKKLMQKYSGGNL
jgi:hypothetical protein